MEPGTVLGSYRLLEPLGSGGMGDVYVAEDRRLGRRVAVKVLKPRFASDPERLERFEREAKAVASLNHPNIVTIHSVEEATTAAGGTVHFLTMELIDGKPLSDRIPKRGLDVAEIFDIAIPLVDAVSTAHRQGIAHRDLKPANILVTGEGRLKVLDFGLAKLLEDRSAGESTEAATYLVTEEGQVLGTVAYMSPEQAEGKPVDHRTDIFSLGILLYEMATGERPFKGDSRISLLSSLIKDTPTSVTDLNRSLPNQLGRIVKRCLEKAPERRFQTALDLKNELEDLREEVSLSSLGADRGKRPATVPPTTVMLPRSWLVSGAALLAVVVAAVGWGLWGRGGESPVSSPANPAATALPAAVSDGRPGLAVLWFDNLSGDASLDWLRTGLTDLLVTDLSQAPDLRVLGTDRLYEILDDLGQTEARVTSAEMVEAVARAAGAERVVLGSFMRAGETVRITARLQEVASGDTLRAESVEADSEAAVFAAVDDLSERLRNGLGAAAASPIGLDRDLTDITTDSVAAYRDYAEAVRLIDRGRFVEAMPRLLAATEADPEFAMAWAKLSVVNSNLFDVPAARQYGERALAHADRLTERERLYIQGYYHSLRPDSIEQSIAAYEQLIELYPDDLAARNNVALQYMELERYDEAAEQLREALRRGTTFSGAPANLASALCMADRCDEAVEVLRDFGRRSPDYVANHLDLAFMHLLRGRLDEAEEALRRFRELALPQEADTRGAWIPEWFVATSREDWRTAAERVEEGLRSEVTGFRLVLAPTARVVQHLYRGRTSEARRAGEELLQAAPPDSPLATVFRLMLAHQLRMADRHEAVIELLDGAPIGESVEQEARSLEILATANARLGRRAVADARAADAERRSGGMPQPRMRRQRLVLRAILELEAGDRESGLQRLREAEALLPPPRVPPPEADHAWIWYLLGRLYHEGGDVERAAPYFEKILQERPASLFFPVYYVRSFWHLGKIAEERGDVEAARRNYGRFLDYWSDGDIDRDRIEQARRFLREH